jgi:hypothetical protein
MLVPSKKFQEHYENPGFNCKQTWRRPLAFCVKISLSYDNHVVTGHAVEGHHSETVEEKLTVSLHRRLIAAALRNSGLSHPPSFDGYLD